MTKLQTMIHSALAAPTASERIYQYLSINPSGLPGATALRGRQELIRARLAAARKPVEPQTYAQYREARESRRRSGPIRKAVELAKAAGQHFDEHGYRRGDYLSTRGIDWVHPGEAREAPYCDMGGLGLALIGIERRRVYAKSSQWYPHNSETKYLVGRNESGTLFAHAVPTRIGTVYGAVQWIWKGKADRILARQGDIALISARAGARIPRLPMGHTVNGTTIHHETHPAIRTPERGEAIIVARRAVVRVSNETRD